VEQVIAVWREQNVKVIELTKAGRYAEANTVYRQKALPRFREMGVAVEEYLKYRDARLASLDQEQDALISSTRLLLIAFSIISLLLAGRFQRRLEP